MEIRLIQPALEWKEKAFAFKQEFFDHGEFIINGSELLDKMESYEEWLKTVKDNASPNTVNPNWVVADTFFAVDETDKIVGMIDLRHSLNDFLSDFGHTGYSVCPSERRKGYATKMLSMLLIVAKEAELEALFISVEKDNIPSVKTIIVNGGIFERSFEFEGKQADIYKISL